LIYPLNLILNSSSLLVSNYRRAPRFLVVFTLLWRLSVVAIDNGNTDDATVSYVYPQCHLESILQNWGNV